MATASGIEAQFGVGQESTYGTYTAPTKTFEFVSESLKYSISRITSAGLRAGRRTARRWKAGTRSVSGDVVLELGPQGLGVLLSNVLGDPTTTGTGPYTHTYAGLANIDTKSMTLQVGRPDNSGTLRAFSYLGCKFTQFKVEASVNEYAKATFSVYGREEVTSQSLAAAAYDADWDPLAFTEGSLTVGGSTVPVTEVSYQIDLSLATDRFRLGATDNGKPKKAVVSGFAAITGSFTADFDDLTQYNHYVNGDEATLVLTFDDGTSTLAITSNVRYDGETPTVGGPDLLTQPVQFTAVSETSDADAITVVLVNDDA